MEQFFRSPAGGSKGIYLISQQSLWLWSGESLSRIADFAGDIRDVRISPDSNLLSFVGCEASNGDIYVYNLKTGQVKRVTYFDDPRIVNIKLDNDSTVTCSTAVESAFDPRIYQVNGKDKLQLPYRDAVWITSNTSSKVVQRFGYGYHLWRNYQGGLAARMFCITGNEVKELVVGKNNACRPIFINDRLFFLCDLNGPMNLYEYHLENNTYTQRTFHTDFNVRDPSPFGEKVLYSVGGSIYEYRVTDDKYSVIPISGRDYSFMDSEFVNVSASGFLTDCDINNKGTDIVFASRGHVFLTHLWDRVGLQQTTLVRYRLAAFEENGSIIRIKDKDDNSIIEIFNPQTLEITKSVELNTGRIIQMLVIDANKLLVENNKGRLLILDLDESHGNKVVEVVRGKLNNISGFDISPDKNWITYSVLDNRNAPSIFLYNITENKTYQITHDGASYSPSFTSDGSYIYYLSDQELKTTYDHFFFNLSFKNNTVVCALCLNKDVPHPFKPWTSKEEEKSAQDTEKGEVDKKDAKDGVANSDKDMDHTKDATAEEKVKNTIVIDEIVAIKSALPTGNYQSILPVSNQKLMLLVKEENKSKSFNLTSADLIMNQLTVLASGVDLVSVSANRQWMVIYNNEGFKVGKCGEQFDENDKSYKNGGSLSITNCMLSLKQKDEWENILHDAWWLLNGHFWHGVPKNWHNVLPKYKQLLCKIRSREDLNYLIEEMIGETQTSHNYIVDRGDLDPLTHPPMGYLGGNFEWDGGGYRVKSIMNTKDFDGLKLMPLIEPGCRLEIGDCIIAVNGAHCTQNVPIEEHLVKKGNAIVALTFKRDGQYHTIYPKTLGSLKQVHYRNWVNQNRSYVHTKSNGKVGYVHIPNMSRFGFTEFHKGYAQERGREALIIDNRYNGGGHVSALLISILRNAQHGVQIFQDQIDQYPDYSNSGLMILLANEYSGSDGDLFTYQFRRHKLGQIVGRRTWGGVVGINPRYPLIDQGMTSQPEFGIWQEDVGISIENFGVEPDVNLESSFDSYDDPQLDYAIESMLNSLPKQSLNDRIKEDLAKYIDDVNK